MYGSVEVNVRVRVRDGVRVWPFVALLMYHAHIGLGGIT